LKSNDKVSGFIPFTFVGIFRINAIRTKQDTTGKVGFKLREIYIPDFHRHNIVTWK
jgi:hypothetical protein